MNLQELRQKVDASPARRARVEARKRDIRLTLEFEEREGRLTRDEQQGEGRGR